MMRFGLSTIVYEPRFRKLLESKSEIDKFSLKYLKTKFTKKINSKVMENLYMTYIDLATKFASKCGFKILEVSGLFDNPQDILPPILKQIKQKIKVFDQITYHPPIRFKSLKAMKQCMIIGKKLGAKKIVLHPYFLAKTPGFKESKTEDIVKLIKFCKKRELIPCLENLPSEMPKYNKPEEFNYYVKKGAFLTIDIGHAVTVNVDPISFMERFGKKVRHIHLQDGFLGMPDSHYALGDGQIDYIKFLNKLEEMKFKDFVVLELVSEKDVIKSMNRLKNFIKS